MQWKWKAWLHIPQATVHSSEVTEAWLAWHSMQRSMMWLRQIAQLSTTMSQAQRATAFHFLTSNLGKNTSQDFSTFPVQNIFNYLFFSPRQEEEGISSSLSTSILFWLELNWRVKLENSGNSLFDDQNATKIRVQKQQLTLHIHLSTWTTKESKIDGKSQSW